MKEVNAAVINFDKGLFVLHGVSIDAQTRWKDIESLPEGKIEILTSGWCWGRAVFPEPVEIFGYRLWAEVLYQNSKLEIRLTPVDDDADKELLEKQDEYEESGEWVELRKAHIEYEKKKFDICMALMRKVTTKEFDAHIAGFVCCRSKQGLRMCVADGSNEYTQSNEVSGALRIQFLPQL